jgi:multiple sugar transport system substrate-binding protein
MKAMKRAVVPRLIAGVAVAALSLATVGLGGVTSAGAASKTTISVAYAVNTTFDTTPLAVKWWGGVQKEFDAKYPQYHLKLVPVQGGEPDFLTKLALLYHNSSTAPDVAQFPSTEIALYQSTGYLLNMSPYLTGSAWFSQYPTVIQNEGKIGGKIYAVSSGENDNAIYYDKAVLQKAGIALPWNPKNWQDILTAAKAIKKAEPKVTPLWIDAGTSAGPNGAGYGALNLLAGSSNPTIQTASGKMVVSSSGLLQTFNFLHEVYSDGLGAPTSELFSPNNAPNIPSALYPKGTLGITIGANFLGGNWAKLVGFPYWAQASTAMGITGLPTANGKSYASTLSGWDYGISATTKSPTADMDLINVMQESTNLINADNWAGWVPPVKADWTIPSYTSFAPPFNEEFGKMLAYSTELPSSSAYNVWVQGFEEATGTLAQTPSTTGAAALASMKSFVTNQLGSSAVTTLP